MENINKISVVNPAKIFLNMFNLILGEGDSEELEIYDRKNNPVGKLYKGSSRVVINANINGYRLDACLTQYQGHRFKTMRHRLFSEETRRNNVVYFAVTGKGNQRINGRIDITANCSEYTGPNCTCSSSIEYRNGKRKNAVLHLNDGYAFFMADLKEQNILKKVILDPKKIYHKITSGKFNEELKTYPYFRESQITDSELGSRFANVIVVDDIIKDGQITKGDDSCFVKDVELVFERGLQDKVDYVQDRENLFILKANTIHLVDTKIDDFLNYLCEGPFMIDNTPLLRNLISVCYDNYSDNVIDAVLGMERDRSFYQDGSQNLTDAYFKINSDYNKTKSI